jgi:hypothetical protein
LVDATSCSVIVNLPPANAAPRRIYIIKKIDSSSNPIYFTADGTTVTLMNQYSGKQIQSNGSGWYVIGSF